MGPDSFLFTSPGLCSMSSSLEFSVAMTCCPASPSLLSLFCICLYKTFIKPTFWTPHPQKPTHSSKPHLNPIYFLKASEPFRVIKSLCFKKSCSYGHLCLLYCAFNVSFLYCCYLSKCLISPKTLQAPGRKGTSFLSLFCSLHRT